MEGFSMAHKPISYYTKAKGEKNIIVLYTNVEPPVAEQKMIDRFVNQGYEVYYEEKKESLTVDKMKAALSADAEALAKFEAIYSGKEKQYKKDGTEEVSYFAACKFYNGWKKKNKKK